MERKSILLLTGLSVLAACSEPTGVSTRRMDAVSDVTPPTLLSLTVTPSSVDVTGGPQTLTVQWHVTDDLAGVSFCDLYLWGPSKTQGGIGVGATVPANLVAGDAMDATLQATLTLPQYSEAGQWTLRFATCRDAASNAISYDQYNPPPTPIAIDVTSVTDSHGPAVVSLTLTPNPVDVTNAAQFVTVDFHVTDDLSGVSFCATTVRSPSGAQVIGMGASSYSLVSGTLNDGVLRGTLYMPQNSEPGQWTIQGTWCTDQANNNTSYDPGNPPPGASAGLVVLSNPDTQPPALTNVTISPAVVDVSQSSASVTVQWQLTDNLSGIDFCSINLWSPSLTQLLAVGSTTLVSGSSTDGVLQATLQIPQYSETGVWTVQSIMCRDHANNTAWFDPLNNPAPFAFPTLTIGVPSVHDLIVRLIAKVVDLHVADALSKGEATSLESKLNNALRQFDAGKSSVAQQLGAFVNEVRALERSGRLTNADAAALVARAEEILGRL